VIRARA